MFGGSATTREVDQDNPIRTASIRGQLRFWWRAIYGRRYPTYAELFAAEEKIFGSDKRHGELSLTVTHIDLGQVVDYGAEEAREGRLDANLMYAVFPFQKKTTPPEPWAKARVDVRFVLGVDPGDAPVDEVALAIRAWSTLGGVGARWRRGCGSVEVRSTTVPQTDLSSLTDPPANDLSHLPAGLFVGSRAPDAEDAWLKAVGLYRDFRQGEGFARNPGTPRYPGDHTYPPGRSRYPEADSIRTIRDTHDPRHQPEHPVAGFPRADLGLPIVFHFRDHKTRDPKDQHLQGADKDHRRFASPVITRALRRPDGYYHPMLMVLAAPPVWRSSVAAPAVPCFPVELKGPGLGPDPRPVSRPEIELTAAERRKIYPLDPSLGRPIRAALLAHAANAKWAYTRIAEVLK